MAETRLILTTSDSGAGHLKQSGIADKVDRVMHRLVSGPVPATADSATFFEVRLALFDADAEHGGGLEAWERDVVASALDPAWRDLPQLCQTFDRVELRIDPDPNAQLLLVQLLDHVGDDTALVDKLWLVHADTPLGERAAPDPQTLAPVFQKVDRDVLATARRAWAAFTQPTPQAWFDLLATDLAALPRLRPAVMALLNELPAAGTALGATEAMLLALIAPGTLGPLQVFAAHHHTGPSRVFDYWEVGRMLDRLARCPKPAVFGLAEGPFDLALHDDAARFQRLRTSRLSLSELGRALVAGNDDFSRHNHLNCWWGGTKLTDDNLWRWNATNCALMPPAHAH